MVAVKSSKQILCTVHGKAEYWPSPPHTGSVVLGSRSVLQRLEAGGAAPKILSCLRSVRGLGVDVWCRFLSASFSYKLAKHIPRCFLSSISPLLR